MTNWQDRFTKRTYERAGDLAHRFNVHNYRLHPDQQRAITEGSLDKLGWIGEVKVAEEPGVMFDGHLRVKIALEKSGPDTPVPTNWYALDADEANQALLVHDTTTGMAGIDFDVLADLRELTPSLDLPEFDSWLDDFITEGLNGKTKEVVDVPPQIDKAEELRAKWGTELGQVWELGRHKVACGDCTDRAVVDAVIEEQEARMIWTDPPYGVKYGDKLNAVNPMNYRVRSIENDNLSPDKLERLLNIAFLRMSEKCLPGASLYAACPAGTPLPVAISAFTGSGFEFKWQLVWVKDQLVLGRGDYHFRHENILYGWKTDASHYFINDRKQDSVFEIPRPKVSDEHPTMKPVELVAKMILNNSKERDVVLDPFLGSGTTLIACEQLNRQCRGIEIEPKYVAVTLERWHQLTGEQPRLL